MSDKSLGLPTFVAGAVIGGAIGAGVALLLAPRTGAETREILRKKAKDLGKELGEVKQKIGPEFNKFKKNLSSKFESFEKVLPKGLQG